MSNIKLVHSGGNSVSLTTPDSNPAANRTYKLPGNADGTILSSTSGSSIQVLEQFYSPCDGSTIATSGGNITLSNITARQQCTSSFANLTGSNISYVPPSGTTQVIYTFQFAISNDGDNNGLLYAGFTVDGNEATDARFTERLSTNYWDTIKTFTWGINIGGSTTAATGRLASWTSAKSLNIDIREHGNDNESQVHYVQNWASGPINQVRKPCIGITAIGVPS